MQSDFHIHLNLKDSRHRYVAQILEQSGRGVMNQEVVDAIILYEQYKSQMMKRKSTIPVILAATAPPVPLNPYEESESPKSPSRVSGKKRQVLDEQEQVEQIIPENRSEQSPLPPINESAPHSPKPKNETAPEPQNTPSGNSQEDSAVESVEERKKREWLKQQINGLSSFGIKNS